MEIYEVTTATDKVLCYECKGTYFCLYEADESEFNNQTILNIERISK